MTNDPLITIAELKMAEWLRKHYHEREANLERDPVAVYAQAKFEPDEVFCYQQLNDWVRENSEIEEVFPEYAAAYADLLTACRAAAKAIEAQIDSIDERCAEIACYCGMPGNEPHSQTYRGNELAMLTAAIAAAQTQEVSDG